MLAKSSENEPWTDGSPICQCGKGTSGCLIHPSTRDEWIASQRDSLVKTLAGLGIKPGSETERAADFTEKCSELLTSFDRDTCSWRTFQPSLLTNSLEPFSETWPRAGMMRGGRVYRHLQPVPRTTVIGGGALQSVPTPTVNGNYNRKGASKTSGDGLATWAKMWQTPVADDAIARKKGKWNSRGEPKLSAEVLMWPTPQARDYRQGDAPDSKRAVRKRDKGWSMNLNDTVRMWPTPCSSASKGSSPASLTRKNGRDRSSDRLDHAVMASDGGQLNPDWTEWLMGFPIGHTALKPSATPKSRSRPRSRG